MNSTRPNRKAGRKPVTGVLYIDMYQTFFEQKKQLSKRKRAIGKQNNPDLYYVFFCKKYEICKKTTPPNNQTLANIKFTRAASITKR